MSQEPQCLHGLLLDLKQRRLAGARFCIQRCVCDALIDSIGFGIILPVTPDLLMSVSGASLASSAVYGGWLMMVLPSCSFSRCPLLATYLTPLAENRCC